MNDNPTRDAAIASLENNASGVIQRVPDASPQDAVLTLDDAAVNLAVLYKLTDQTLSELRPAWSPCAAGCSWCCWSLNVLITWIEAYYVFMEVKRWSPEAKKELARRARAEVTILLGDPVIAEYAAADATTNAITPDKFPRLQAAMRNHLRPCPFLNRETNQCSVYEERFMACRLFGTSVASNLKGENVLYGCNVVEKVAGENSDTHLLDARPVSGALMSMAGAPTVYARPVSFWIDMLAQGEEENLGYSLDDPESIFAKLMFLYQPFDFTVKEQYGQDDNSAHAMGLPPK